jgi:hypothetical protein
MAVNNYSYVSASLFYSCKNLTYMDNLIASFCLVQRDFADSLLMPAVSVLCHAFSVYNDKI